MQNLVVVSHMARSDGGVADHLEKNAHVLRVLNFVALSHTIWTQVGIPKKSWGRWGHTPSDGVVADT